jgi:hypothetical protein
MVSIIGLTPASELNFSVASPVAGSPVSAPSMDRLPKIRAEDDSSIGSGATPTAIK